MRQAIAQDLVVLQGAYGDRSEVEQGIYMMARLAAGKEPIRLSEIQTLSVPDFRLLSDLVAKCTGMDLDEEEELDEGK